MTYEYRCKSCQESFDVTKSVRDIDVNETCPGCGEFAERKFVPTKLHLTGTKVTNAEYNPAFGCVVKNKAHRDDLAKARGMVEVGNDFKSGNKIDEKFTKDREAKLAARLNDTIKGA